MAPMTMRRSRLDDDDLYDDDGNGPYDKRYPGQRVIGDRGRVRVPIMLSDAMPPEYRAAMSMSLQRNDAARHRPHQIVSDSAELRDAEREAARAYDKRNDFLRDAWRSPSNPSPPDHDDDGLSPRDQYVERITSAWRAPPRRNDPSDDVEALQRRWASAGATAGPGRRPAQDAAPRSDADQAYEEYCARLQAAWKTR